MKKAANDRHVGNHRGRRQSALGTEKRLEVTHDRRRGVDIDSRYGRRGVATLAQILQELLGRGGIAATHPASPATADLELPQPTLVQSCQRELAPLEPAVEVGQQVTLGMDRVRCVSLARELCRKAFDAASQRSCAEKLVSCSCLPSGRHRSPP
jgi:hypothetical protein